MTKNIYARLEELERISAAVQQTRVYATAGQAGREWLRDLEIRYGIEQMEGESRMDALARTFGISSRELKERLERRASGSDDADGPGWSD
jgi:hypothetical protein